jgi:hypothetical protein
MLGMERHQVGVGLDMSCLFFLVSINPDLACVFLGSYLLVLLHDLIGVNEVIGVTVVHASSQQVDADCGKD